MKTRITSLNMTGMKHVITLVACVLVPNHGAYAVDENDSQLEFEYFSEIPLVHTVSRIPQTLSETPASVTIIDRQMIEASGARDIPDLFRMVPGFQVGHYSGNRTTVTYHGMSDEYARRMQVLVDGRSVYLPATGGVDWFDLPLSMSDIERIEITRGPNGVSYGANAFLATINIITYDPIEIIGTNLNIETGANRYRKGFVRHAESSGLFDYRLSVEYQADDGYADAESIEKGVSDDRLKDDKLVKKASFRGEYRIGVNDLIGVRLGVNSGTYGDGVEGDPTLPPRDVERLRNYEQINWRRLIGAEEDIELKFYHERSDVNAKFKTVNLSEIFDLAPDVVELLMGVPDQGVVVDQGYLVNRYDLELVHRLRVSEHFRLAWAGELRLDEVSAEGFFGTDETIRDELYRLSANGEWTVTDALYLNAGVMVEKNEITGLHYSPRMAINYTWSDNHSLRAVYSRAYRTPAFLEAYADYAARFELDGSVADQLWMKSDDLDPEKITSIEIGASGLSRNGIFNYDVRLFKENLRDLITIYRNGNSTEPYSHYCMIFSGWCYANAFNNDASADMHGIETQLTYVPNSKLRVNVGLSYVDSSGDIRVEDNDSDPSDDFVRVSSATPMRTASVLFDYRPTTNWDFGLGYYHVDDMKFFGGNDTGGYSVVDFRVARQLELGRHSGIASLYIKNLMNNHYYDYRNEVVLDRSVYLGFELSL